MLPQELNRIRNLENKFFSLLLKWRAKAMYAEGEISEEILQDPVRFKKVVIEDIAAGREENIIVDHRETLQGYSEEFTKKNHPQMSKVLLATQIEHTLNAIIVHYCSRNGLGTKTAKEVIRSTSLTHKTGWLLKVFGYPEIPKEHVSIIKRLADERNSFIHYKWTPLDRGIYPREEDGKNDLQVEEVVPTVEFLSKYERNIRFDGNLELIEQLFSNLDILEIQQLVAPEVYRKLRERLTKKI